MALPLDRFTHAKRYRRRITEAWAIQLVASEGNQIAKNIADLADGVAGIDDYGNPYVAVGGNGGVITLTIGDYLVVDEDGANPVGSHTFDGLYAVDAEPRKYTTLELVRHRANQAALRTAGRRREYRSRREGKR